MDAKKNFRAKVITLVADKGGPGKTTLAVNIAATLAEEGKKVLLIDFDEQCNAGFDIGFTLYNMVELENDKTFPGGRNAKQLFLNEEVDMSKLMIKSPLTELPTLDFIPSSLRMMFIERLLIDKRKRIINEDGVFSSVEKPEARVLLKTFNNNKKVLDEYDYVIIDTKPSLSLINENAITAAAQGSILIPTEPSFNSLYGIATLFNYWDIVKQEIALEVECNEAIVLNRYKATGKLDKAVYAVLIGDFENKNIPEEMTDEVKAVFDGFSDVFIDVPIKETAIFRQRSAQKIPIVLYADAREKKFLNETWYPFIEQLKDRGIL